MGIDQLGFQSVQIDYLKILQMGNTDPNNTKARKNTRSHQAQEIQPAQNCYLAGYVQHSRDLPGAQIKKLKRAEELSDLTCKNIRATLLLHVPSPTSTQEMELVSIKRATQDELIATDPASNNGGNR
ncbi:NAD kinase 2, chloroplastic [Dorcoceras hygrometricum]|uniref:NAD kinase 2, chloroplastic n=1 Tax=Dorcoceras hygrometricum TaxID=472368 RepID=A0A2Z7CS02_9LAMI|nr:NAD kinase 2, chloroplastic [Dorcoceras hygrometricum]